MSVFLKVNVKNNYSKNKENKVVNTEFVYPSEWIAGEINVLGYSPNFKGGCDYCVIETNNTLGARLLKNNASSVKKLSKSESVEEVKFAKSESKREVELIKNGVKK